MKSGGHNYSKLPTSENDEFVSGQKQVFHSQLREQDKHLDILEDSLKRLGSLGKGIQDEIELQNKMLNELEADVESGAINLETVQGKLDYMIKKSGGPKYCTIIVVLSIILAILTFLVIYT